MHQDLAKQVRLLQAYCAMMTRPLRCNTSTIAEGDTPD
jgi:hypothetical protein